MSALPNEAQTVPPKKRFKSSKHEWRNNFLSINKINDETEMRDVLGLIKEGIELYELQFANLDSDWNPKLLEMVLPGYQAAVMRDEEIEKRDEEIEKRDEEIEKRDEEIEKRDEEMKMRDYNESIVRYFEEGPPGIASAPVRTSKSVSKPHLHVFKATDWNYTLQSVSLLSLSNDVRFRTVLSPTRKSRLWTHVLSTDTLLPPLCSEKDVDFATRMEVEDAFACAGAYRAVRVELYVNDVLPEPESGVRKRVEHDFTVQLIFNHRVVGGGEDKASIDVATDTRTLESEPMLKQAVRQLLCLFYNFNVDHPIVILSTYRCKRFVCFEHSRRELQSSEVLPFDVTSLAHDNHCRVWPDSAPESLQLHLRVDDVNSFEGVGGRTESSHVLASEVFTIDDGKAMARAMTLIAAKMLRLNGISALHLTSTDRRSFTKFTETTAVRCALPSDTVNVSWKSTNRTETRNAERALYGLDLMYYGSISYTWAAFELLPASRRQAVARVVKFLIPPVDGVDEWRARQESIISDEVQLWNEIYASGRDGVGLFDVSAAKLNGVPALVMPFFARAERSVAVLGKVRLVLEEKFHKSGYKHTDMKWAHVAVALHCDGDESVPPIVVLDLGKEGVQKLTDAEKGDSRWIDEAIQKLQDSLEDKNVYNLQNRGGE